MKRKGLALLLAGAMITPMIGCGEGQKPQTSASSSSSVSSSSSSASGAQSSSPQESTAAKQSETEEETGPYPIKKDKDGKKIDLGGITVTQVDWWTGALERKRDTAYDEAYWDYIEWLEKTYNFTYATETPADVANYTEQYMNYVMTNGDDRYLMFIIGDLGQVYSRYPLLGLYYDIGSLDCIDFTEEKWQRGKMHEKMNFNGKIYTMNADYPELQQMVMFNKKILKDAGIDYKTLYDMPAKGEWTWEKLAELAKATHADKDGDGNIDIFGYESHWSCDGGLNPAILSNGVNCVTRENGKFVNNMESEASVEAMNWWTTTMPPYMCFDEKFKDGNAAFTVASYFMAEQYFSKSLGADALGLLPLPKGPKSDKCRINFKQHLRVIPSCYDAEKAWKIAFVYNAITEPVPGFEDYDPCEFYYKFYEEDDVEKTLRAAMEDPDKVFNYYGWIDGFSIPYLLAKEPKTVSELLESVRGKNETAIKSANELKIMK